MKYGILLIMSILPIPSLASDSVTNMICNAYKKESDKERCYAELSSNKSEKQRSNKTKRKVQTSNAITDEQIAYVFDIMQKAFIGKHSVSSIKSRLDTAMKLYNTPITYENYNRCASALVTMRKHSGHSEMDILQYMIKMYSQNSNFDFPTGTAYASTLMGN